MNSLEKLQVLLPHWIEHNQGHGEECRKWVEQLQKEEESADVQGYLAAALSAMDTVSEQLEKALQAAGGAKEDGHHHHNHHH
jgi:hypothetical protein